MQLSNAGLNLIKTGEGFKPHLYNCPPNDASIGYGHLVEHAFEHLVTLTQGQYDALGRSGMLKIMGQFMVLETCFGQLIVSEAAHGTSQLRSEQKGCVGQLMGSIGHYSGRVSRCTGRRISSYRWQDNSASGMPPVAAFHCNQHHFWASLICGRS